jgi:molecular chaperone HtpG
MLYPTTEGEFLTYDELEAAVKDNQTDKDGKLIFLYASNIEEQHSYIETAKDKGYKVLLLDSPIIGHLIQKLEGDKEKIAFARVDGDAVENLIKKEEATVSKLSDDEKNVLKPLIEAVVPSDKYTIQMEAMDSGSLPFVITQPEFMRRMKEMQQTGGGMMGAFPEMFTLLVNTNHELVGQILNTKTTKKRERLIQQSLDLARLSQNLLKGEALTTFIKRSVDLIK